MLAESIRLSGREGREYMNRGTSLEDKYIQWLVDQVNVIEGKNYGMLLRELYRVEFYSILKYDEDRGSDGMALRDVWAREIEFSGDTAFGPPRVLEVIIGISIRIEKQIFGGPWADVWDYPAIFWDLIINLGLVEYDGVLTAQDYKEVVTVLECFLSKASHCYTFNNIFTFFVTPKNLRKLNLWSQMHLYIREKWPGNTYL